MREKYNNYECVWVGTAEGSESYDDQVKVHDRIVVGNVLAHTCDLRS